MAVTAAATSIATGRSTGTEQWQVEDYKVVLEKLRTNPPSPTLFMGPGEYLEKMLVGRTDPVPRIFSEQFPPVS